MVGRQAVLGSAVSPATIDALAALEAGAEDRGVDPAEAQGDSELAIESAAWSWSCFLASLAAGGALKRSGALPRPAPARGRHSAATTSEALARPAPDLRVLRRLRAVQGQK